MMIVEQKKKKKTTTTTTATTATTKQQQKHEKRRLMMAGASQAITNQQAPTMQTPAAAATTSMAASHHHHHQIAQAATTRAAMAHDLEEGDNDEENIVIDMCDEDDEDDEEEEAGELANFDYDRDDSANEFRNRLLKQPANDGIIYSTGNTYNYDNNNEINYSPYSKQQQQQQQQVNASSEPLLASSDTQQVPFGEHDDADDAAAGFASRFNVGDLIWFDPNQLGYSIPGKVIDIYADLQVLTVEGCAQPGDAEVGDNLESYSGRLLAADEQLQVYDLSERAQLSTIKPRAPLTNESGKRDLIGLVEELSLESIIWNLKLRYKQELIYTKCGSRILISVNPFKQLNNIYDLDQANRYDSFGSSKLRCLNKFELYYNQHHHHGLSEHHHHHQASGGRNKAPICGGGGGGGHSQLMRWLLLDDDTRLSAEGDIGDEAHIFALANRALMKLLIGGQDQCFVLLGESGSGKTEACKLLVQYLASVNKSPTNLMTEQILESIQVLESFGNARTIHNDNSSRFGKVLEIELNLTNGFIMNGKTIDLNLLDRSRIVGQVEGERNYHIFYELLAGLSSLEKEKYGLQGAEKYFYLNQGNCVELNTKEDGEDFRSLLASMQVLGFNYEEQDTIFRVLAAVLHLGNIYFHRKVVAVRSLGKLAPPADGSASGGGGATSGIEGVEIGSDTEVRWISHLLQIQFDSVLRCLTVRTIEAGQGQDRIVSPLNIDQALDTRDAIARTLYSCLFRWLVQRINVMISDCKAAVVVATDSSPASQDMSDREQQQAAAAMDSQRQSAYGSLCRTSESLCEFQPDKLTNSRDSTLMSSSASSSAAAAAGRRKQQQQQQHRLKAAAAGQRLTAATISILDSFGFENLRENNFEQLCINYSAELINYHTSRYLLRLEQAEYTKERLKWTPISWSTMGDQPSSSLASGGGGGGASIQQSPASCQLQANHLGMANSTGGGGNCAAGVVNLLSKKPLGILALLDDECNFPKATDQSFVEKCHHNHTLNENYQRARLAPNCNQEFGIRHFRQQSKLVWYQVDGFVEKNRDSLRPDIVDLLLNSRMLIVIDMLKKLGSGGGGGGGGARSGSGSTLASASASSSAAALDSSGKTLSRTYDGRYVSMKPRATTVAAKFQDTLANNRVLESINRRSAVQAAHTAATQPASMMPHTAASRRATSNADPSHQAAAAAELSNATLAPPAEPWFIVCLKPNRSRTPGLFDVSYVQDQALCMNLYEISSIRQRGYPFRVRFDEFVREYLCIVPSKYLHSLSVKRGQIKRGVRDVCKSIVNYAIASSITSGCGAGGGSQEFQCGLTKVFMNERLFKQLEQIRLRVHQQAILLIQKSVRMWLARDSFLAQRRASIVIQARLRGYLARKEFWRQYMLMVALQRRWRAQLELRRARQLELRRQMRRQRAQNHHHRHRLQQAHQTAANQQLRYRQLKPSSSALDPTNKQQHYYAPRLEIPHDLAQLYRLQRDWLPVHNLSHLREIGRRPAGSAAAEAPSSSKLAALLELDDERYSFESFLLEFYPSEEVPQFGYSRAAITRPFNWPRLVKLKRAAIKRAATIRRTTEQQANQARLIGQRFESTRANSIALYKLILRYIDSDASEIEQDSNTQSASQKLIKFKLLADYVIYLCLREPLLRDEIFLQLASLSWLNPRPKSVDNCWRFMLNCLSCFGPQSGRLTRHLFRYTLDECNSERYRASLLSKLANYLRAPAARQQRADNCRQLPPSILEYWANSRGIRSLLLQATSFDCSTEDEEPQLIELESHTSSQQFADSAIRAMFPEMPAANRFGWSVEFAPAAATASDDSCSRQLLRGDEMILDHLSELELQPEFVDLIQSGGGGGGSATFSNHEQIEPCESDPSTRVGGGGAGILSQTSRLNRRYHLQQQQPLPPPAALLSQSASCTDECCIRPAQCDCCREPGSVASHYEQPAMQMQMHLNTSKGQFSRRSMSMQELQLVGSSTPNGRHFANHSGQLDYQSAQAAAAAGSQSQHYACSNGFAGPPGRQRRRRGPSVSPSDGRARRRSQTPNSMEMGQPYYYAYQAPPRGSSAYGGGGGGSESNYCCGPALMQQNSNRRHQDSNSLNRNRRPAAAAAQQPRWRQQSAGSSASASSFAATAAAGGQQLRPLPACCQPDYERLGPAGAAAFHAPAPSAKKHRAAYHRPAQSLLRKSPARRLSERQAAAGESHYVASSAMSDTSEAPSLASHVRAVKVPQDANGDLDQYLDDLFNPMLDHELLLEDELSDARSLAAAAAASSSIRPAKPASQQLLENLCDPAKLSKIIRGRDDDRDQPDPADQARLSPTFESLLFSLRNGTTAAGELDQSGHSSLEHRRTDEPPPPLIADPHELGTMNLSQLKALNERLEQQLDQSNSRRRPGGGGGAFESAEVGDSSSGIPEPPPQPSFGAIATQPPPPIDDDLYDREKTIRIGKWRWPPQRPAESTAGAATAPAESEPPSWPPAEQAVVAPKAPPSQAQLVAPKVDSCSEATAMAPSMGGGSIGKLRISSEMKAKLEQLTNSSGSSAATPAKPSELVAQPPAGSGIVSQARLSLLALGGGGGDSSGGGQISRLGSQRKNLLESQLLGGGGGAGGESPHSSGSGGKVMAAKQQLAAAAGLALDQLDSGSAANSRAASRRHSAAYSESGACGSKLATAARDLQADELGPQSRSAISQRLAFYQMAAASSAEDLLSRRSSRVCAGPPMIPESEETLAAAAGADCATSEGQPRSSEPELATRHQHIPMPTMAPSDRAAGSNELEPPVEGEPTAASESGANETLAAAPAVASQLKTQSPVQEKPHLQLYGGQSIAKSLAQRQQETLKGLDREADEEREEARDWVASSRPVDSNRKPASNLTLAAAASGSRPQSSNKRLHANERLPSGGGGGAHKRSRPAATGLSSSRGQPTKASGEQQQQQPDVGGETSTALTYANVDWRLRIRKELFRPSESYDNPIVLQLLFSQLVADCLMQPDSTVANNYQQQPLTKLNNKERAAIRSLMRDNSIRDGGHTMAATRANQISQQVKLDMVKLARSFGLYFTRSYVATNYALTRNSNDGIDFWQRPFPSESARRRSASVQSDDDDSSSSSSSLASDSSQCSQRQGPDSLLESAGTPLADQMLARLKAANNLGSDWIDSVAVHHSGLRLVVVAQRAAAPANASERGEAAAAATANGCVDGSSGANQQQQQSALGRQHNSSNNSNNNNNNNSAGVGYRVLETLKYRDMTDVSLVGQRELLVSMRNGRKCWLLSSDQATQLYELLKSFHSDYNNHLENSKGDTPLAAAAAAAAAAPPAAAKFSNSAGNNDSKQQQQQQQQQQQPRPARKQQEQHQQEQQQQRRQPQLQDDALLASDDDHDGDHLAQRQTSDRVHELRKAAHSDHDLADRVRILPDHLAPPGASSASVGRRPAAAAASSVSPSAAAAAASHSIVPSQSAAAAANGGHQREQPSSQPAAAPEVAASRDTNNRRHQQPALDGPAGGQVMQAANQRDGQQQQQQQLAAATTGSSSSSSIGKKSKKNQASNGRPWHSSLSRMSNKFSLFGSHSKGSSSAANKQQQQQQQPGGSQLGGAGEQQQQVALDAWIEAKVDFDEDDDACRESLEGGFAEQTAAPAVQNDEGTRRGEATAAAAAAANSKSDEQQQQQESISLSSGGRSQIELQQQQQRHQAAADNSKQASESSGDGRFSLLQFALYNFREAIDKYSLESKMAGKSGGDTSTLRGSLKFIETLRRGGGGSSSNGSQLALSGGSDSSSADRKLAANNNNDSNDGKQQQQQPVGSDWTWRELAQMVKFASKPIKSSLLKLPSSELNRRAIECFAAILQYMGDLAPAHPSSKLNEVDCVYLILMNCHNYPILRDEIYCQLMKQTTNNRSGQPDSCLRAWRLFSMVAAYFNCSDLLKPYLLKYLETAAYDKRRAYCSIALICLQNLRKTFKFGGRKNVPSIEEIAATSAGRNSKRQIYRLPGGTERVINTKSTTVVEDIIQEICSSMLNVSDAHEMLEFSLYCIADGDLYTMPLNRDEYILDVTTELIKSHQQYFLIFCRSIWHYPLRLDCKLYIEVIFNQIAPDYLEGLLLVLPDLRQHMRQQSHYNHHPRRSSSSFTSNSNSNQQATSCNPDNKATGNRYQLRLRAKLVGEIARIAALLHRASGTDHMPHRDEIKYLLPKPIIAAMKYSRQQQQQRLASSADSFRSGSSAAGGSQPLESRANCCFDSTASDRAAGAADEDGASIELSAAAAETPADTIVTTPQKWVELVQENWREMSAFDTLDAKAQFLEIVRHWPLFGSSFFAIKLIQRDLIQPMEFILALNKLGIQMLDTLTHETVHKYPFNEVISTRKVRSEDGALFLDLKCGNLMKRTIIRIQTDQAHEISRLIRQYIDIELIQQKQHQQNQHQQLQQLGQASDGGAGAAANYQGESSPPTSSTKLDDD